MKGLLRASKERALMTFPEIGKISPEGLIPILKELKRRHVLVRILMSQGDKKAVACYKELADTRLVQGVENRYVIVDNSVLHIFLSKSDLGTDSWSAIWSTHKKLPQAVRGREKGRHP
jgi:hypothetical protein